MKWVTKARPKIDRIACPWLIEGSSTRSQSSPVWTRSYGCSFDASLSRHALTEPALARLAAIVRGADTSRLDLTPESAGLYAMSVGLSLLFEDDHEMLRHGMVMYDALYAWCRTR
jgi:hypothetical protein